MRGWVALVLLAGCGTGDQLQDLELVGAELLEVDLVAASAIVGVQSGEALLRVETTDGEVLDVPVRLSGPRLGSVFGLAYGFELVPLPLLTGAAESDEGAFPGDALLGTYEGWGSDATAVVGYSAAMLVNEEGVQMPLVLLTLGASAGVGATWVTLEEMGG